MTHQEAKEQDYCPICLFSICFDHPGRPILKQMKLVTSSFLGCIFHSLTQRNTESVPHTALLTPGFCILGLLVRRCTRHCKFIHITRNTAQKTHSTYGWSEQNNDSGASEIPLDTCPSFFVGYQLNRTQLGQSIELPLRRGPDFKSSALGLACWLGG